MKNTNARKLLLDIFENSKELFTAEQLFELLKDHQINLSTIYRNLKTFEENHIIKKEKNIDSKIQYTLASNHYHVLQCNECDDKITLPYCPYTSFSNELNDKFEFKLAEQNTIIYGTCKKCH